MLQKTAVIAMLIMAALFAFMAVTRQEFGDLFSLPERQEPRKIDPADFEGDAVIAQARCVELFTANNRHPATTHADIADRCGCFASAFHQQTLPQRARDMFFPASEFQQLINAEYFHYIAPTTRMTPALRAHFPYVQDETMNLEDVFQGCLSPLGAHDVSYLLGAPVNLPPGPGPWNLVPPANGPARAFVIGPGGLLQISPGIWTDSRGREWPLLKCDYSDPETPEFGVRILLWFRKTPPQASAGPGFQPFQDGVTIADAAPAETCPLAYPG